MHLALGLRPGDVVAGYLTSVARGRGEPEAPSFQYQAHVFNVGTVAGRSATRWSRSGLDFRPWCSSRSHYSSHVVGRLLSCEERATCHARSRAGLAWTDGKEGGSGPSAMGVVITCPVCAAREREWRPDAAGATPERGFPSSRERSYDAGRRTLGVRNHLFLRPDRPGHRAGRAEGGRPCRSPDGYGSRASCWPWRSSPRSS